MKASPIGIEARDQRMPSCRQESRELLSLSIHKVAHIKIKMRLEHQVLFAAYPPGQRASNLHPEKPALSQLLEV